MSNNQYPDGWTEMTFGEMAEQVSERVDDPKTAGVEVYVGLEHLDPEDLRIRRRGTPDDVEATKLRVRPGQIIFGKRRAYQRKVAVADFDGIASAHAMILQEKPALYPGFLPFFMQSDVFMDRAVTISEGGLSPTIKWKTLAAEKFLLPPPEQQRELVELMQGFERAIEAGERVAAAATQFEQLLALDLLNITTDAKPLREFAVKDGIQTGPFGSQLKAGEYTATGTPVVMPKDIQNGQIQTDAIARVPQAVVDRLPHHVLQAGDIVFARRGDLSKIALIDENTAGFICGTGCLRFRPKPEVIPSLLFKHLTKLEVIAWLNENSVGTTMPNLNTTIIGRVPTPDLSFAADKQERVSNSLNAAAETASATKTHVEQLGQLRFSILNTALSPSATAEAAAEVPA